MGITPNDSSSLDKKLVISYMQDITNKKLTHLSEFQTVDKIPC